jgi:hypothetical protein
MEVSVPQLPDNPNFDHLKKQAKDLLRQTRANDPQAFERLRRSLPVAAGKDDCGDRGSRTQPPRRSILYRSRVRCSSWRNLRTYVDWCNSKLSTARTLSWASRNFAPSEGDRVGCARALVEHGMPIPEFGDDYSDEVAAYFAQLR